MRITIDDAVILLESLGEEKTNQILCLAASSEVTVNEKDKQLREFISHELLRIKNEIADDDFAYTHYGNVVGVLLDLLNQIATTKYLAKFLGSSQKYVEHCADIYSELCYDSSKLFRSLVFIFKIDPYLWLAMIDQYMETEKYQNAYAKKYTARYGINTYFINGYYYRFYYKRYDRILRFEKKLTKRQRTATHNVSSQASKSIV